MSRLRVDNFTVGCSSHWHTQDLGIGANLTEEPLELLCWVAVFIGEHEILDWEWANLNKVATFISCHLGRVWGWARLNNAATLDGVTESQTGQGQLS